MNSEVKKSNFLFSILSILVGLLLLIFPRGCLNAIVLILGLATVANGIFNLIKVRVLVAEPEFHTLVTARAFISIIVGSLAVLLPLIFKNNLWSVMVLCLAFYLLISAVMELFAISKMKAYDIETKPYVTEILGSIIMAIIFFIVVSNKVGDAILRIIGALILLLGIAFVVVAVKSRPMVVYAEEVPNDPNEEFNSEEPANSEEVKSEEVKEEPEKAKTEKKTKATSKKKKS